MSLMTLLAFSSHHVSAMWFMTLGAGRNFPVSVVAIGAGKAGVLALELLEFDNLLRMTGDAFVGYVLGQLGGSGGMRVAVAALAISQFVMRLATMTLRTERNNILNSRWMAIMTILTGNARFVCATIGSDVSRCSGMTLHAILITENRMLLKHRLSAKSDATKYCYQYRC